MSKNTTAPQLLIILGDQLDLNSTLLKNLNKKHDEVWMAEVENESTQVLSHQARIALFLSAMRHFRDELVRQGFQVNYQELGRSEAKQTLGDALSKTLRSKTFSKVHFVEPGEWRVLEELKSICEKFNLPFQIHEDETFLITSEEFNLYAKDKKGLRMEFFYRMMRKKYSILMDGDQPMGWRWNFDKDNRESLTEKQAQKKYHHRGFKPDSLTQKVFSEVRERFGPSSQRCHPGQLDQFDWPVTRQQALLALKDFIENHLENFGQFQDAMWTDEPYLHHSKLAAALNLKLLRPLEVIEAAQEAYRSKLVPLSSAEGFIRQILGWREYVRGVYFHFMPEYLERNALKANGRLPDFFWTGKTQMNCLKQVVEQTLAYGYAHHIQRLMVTGLYCLLLGVNPKRVHEWYLAVYVDAVEWVELPNTLGMSQYADEGVMASKPYIASGKYIQRMSNYCDGCAYDPGESTGKSACPYTTLYWDFVRRHRKLLQGNPRLGAQVRNWDRFDSKKQNEIQKLADALRTS